MEIYIKLLKESLIFSIIALATNKLRTFLSLLGISIGIFSIISVFTAVDSLELQIRNSVEDLGNNILFVQKWPWVFGGSYPWWDFISRPYPTPDEYAFISKHSTAALGCSFTCSFSSPVAFKDNGIDEQEINGVSAGYGLVRNFQISQGRYFTPHEISSGVNACILGDQVALDLFNGQSPVGKTIKIGGRKTRVIGVFEREGESMIGYSLDAEIVLNLNYAKLFVNIRSSQSAPMISVCAKPGVSNDMLKEELIRLIRAKRKLQPRTDNDFAINELSIITKGFASFFSVINIIGAIIGGFSIIIGAVSISNIMFVSVQERTKIIGIQKALGARNEFILFQFLSESIFLSLIGGVIGIIVIAILTLGINLSTDYTIVLTANNVFVGVSISFAIGILSGFIPALQAARKDPVEAIRSN